MPLFVAVRAFPKGDHRVCGEGVDDGRDGVDPDRGPAGRILCVAGKHAGREDRRDDQAEARHAIKAIKITPRGSTCFWTRHQSGVGRCTASTRTTSKRSRPGSRRSPSCSCSAAKIDGPSSGGGLAPGAGATGLLVHCRSKLNAPVSPVRSTIGRPVSACSDAVSCEMVRVPPVIKRRVVSI